MEVAVVPSYSALHAFKSLSRGMKRPFNNGFHNVPHMISFLLVLQKS
jgi:hypothetical protein